MGDGNPVMADSGAPRLLILNQMASPMTWELAEDLGKALGSVALLTGHPDTLAKGSTPAVQLFAAAPYQRNGYGRRALSWLRYLWQASVWLWRWPAATRLLLFSNPPLLPWLGYLMRRLRGQRYAVMVHDVYPDCLLRLGILSERHPVTRIWYRLNRSTYERADVVMTLSEGMAANLERQFDPARTSAGCIEVIYPWADTDMIRPLPKEENWFAIQHGQVGKLTVLYSGNLGLSHDFGTMVEAARRLQDREDIHFMIIGAGSRWTEIERAASELPNLIFLPYQPEEVLPFSLATGDVTVVSLDYGFEGISMPSKTYYMMAAGAAILGLSKRPSDLQMIIEQYQCGISVEPGDVDGFVGAILKCRNDTSFLSHCRKAARATAEGEFSREVNTQRVYQAISPLVLRRWKSA